MLADAFTYILRAITHDVCTIVLLLHCLYKVHECIMHKPKLSKHYSFTTWVHFFHFLE